MGIARISQIPREIRGNRDRCCGNTAGGMEMGATGIPRGRNLFLREPREYALEILQTIKILVQALEHWVNCAAKFLTWLLNV